MRLAAGAAEARGGGAEVAAAMVLGGGRWGTGSWSRASLPLAVDCREPAQAVGMIPATALRQERGDMRPRERAAARAVDTSLRALLPEGLDRQMEVAVEVRASDGRRCPRPLAIGAASAAIQASGLPWEGPVAAVRVSLPETGGEPVLDPTQREAAAACIDLRYSGTREGAVHLDVKSREASQDDLKRALEAAAAAVGSALDAQQAPRAALPPLGQTPGPGAPPPPRPLGALGGACSSGRVAEAGDAPEPRPALARWEPYAPCPEAVGRVRRIVDANIAEAVAEPGLTVVERIARVVDVRQNAEQRLRAQGAWRVEPVRVVGSGCVAASDLGFAVAESAAEALQNMVISQSLRVGGRATDEPREVQCEAAVTPGAHGSAVFESGDSQVLATATISKLEEQMRISDLFGESRRSFFADFSLPGYASGALSRPMGTEETLIGSQRRAWAAQWADEAEIADFVEGALAAVLPEEDEMPFCVRVSAKALGSDGSVSGTALCACTMALQDAGVALLRPVAAGTVGLLRGANGGHEDSDYELLVDPEKVEEVLGTSSLHLAGTTQGLTAVRFSAYSGSVPIDVLCRAVGLAAATTERRLEVMLGAVEAAKDLQPQAQKPVFGSIDIKKDYIGRVIGPAGATIKGIEAKTGASVRIDSDSGKVAVFAPSSEAYTLVETFLADIQNGAEKGRTYPAMIKSIVEYGAYVELQSGISGLLHISEASHEYMKTMEDGFSVGDSFDVMCIGHDARGTPKFSRKSLLPKQKASSASGKK